MLTNTIYRFKRIGLEAGPLSQWLFSALAEAGLPVICVETRHMRAALKARINKTDRNDARGIAQMMRVGLYSRIPRTNASRNESLFEAPARMYPTRGVLPDCCARAATGHVAAAPPSSPMNSRRFTRSPRPRG